MRFARGETKAQRWLEAKAIAMIDVDVPLYCEYRDQDKEPLALIETAIDRGQSDKTATVTRRLAERAGIPAYTTLYRLSGQKNPADKSSDVWDIDRFRVKELHPNPSKSWLVMTPQQYYDFLRGIRLEQDNPTEPK
jgi:hypothetical protein